MFIRLTNAATGHEGRTLYINTRNIMTVYEEPLPGDVISTRIRGVTGDVWYVTESLEQVIKKISF